MTNNVGPLIANIVKSTGRSVATGALILFGLGAWIALEPPACAQVPVADAPLAGGVRGSGTIPGTRTGFPSSGRFAPPPDPIALANTAEMRKASIERGTHNPTGGGHHGDGQLSMDWMEQSRELHYAGVLLLGRRL